MGSNFVTGAAMAFRSELRRWCLPVATDVRDLIHDGWIALVAAAASDIVPVSEPLIAYRLHEAQTIGLGKPPNLDRPRLPLLLFEPVDFDTELRDLTTVRDALRSLDLPPRAEPRLRRLEHMIGHWARRSNLPTGVARRAGVVARELANRRYFAYSRGLRSAGKDLLFGPRPAAGQARGTERVDSERR